MGFPATRRKYNQIKHEVTGKETDIATEISMIL